MRLPSLIYFSSSMLRNSPDDAENSMKEGENASESQERPSKREGAWSIFNSDLKCEQCNSMFNNRERKPLLICSNEHLLCRSCFRLTRKDSVLCPFCRIVMSQNPSSNHEQIAGFLRTYDRIEGRSRERLQESRDNKYRRFVIPKNLKTIIIVLLMLVAPWLIEFQKNLIEQIVSIEAWGLEVVWSEVSLQIKMLIDLLSDVFYLKLFQNNEGVYVFQGQEYLTNNPPEEIYTREHKARILAAMFWINALRNLSEKTMLAVKMAAKFSGFFFYWLHHILALLACVQLPLAVPLILVKLDKVLPDSAGSCRYRLNIYFELLQSTDEEVETQYFLDPAEVETLTKVEIYFFLCLRNYIDSLHSLYKEIEKESIKRSENLSYKRQMAKIVKDKKTNSQKTKTKFSFS